MTVVTRLIRIFITEVGNIMPPLIMAALLILCMAIVRGAAIEIGISNFVLNWISGCCIYVVTLIWEAL